MYCESCGNQIDDSVVNCNHCGHNMKAEKKKINLKKSESQEPFVQSKINLAKKPSDKEAENYREQQGIAEASSINDNITNTASTDIIFCTSCGGDNDEQNLFCKHCGYKLIEESIDSNMDIEHVNLNNPGLSGVENSAYQLKVNPAYPVYIPQTLEEKRAVVALSFIDNWNRVMKEKRSISNDRASRREYWLVFLVIICVDLLLLAIFEGVGKSGKSVIGRLSKEIIMGLNLFIIVPWFRVTVRRLHDIGKSGWWILVSFFPYVGALFFLYLMAQQGDAHINEYGKPENYYEATPEERKALGIDK